MNITTETRVELNDDGSLRSFRHKMDAPRQTVTLPDEHSAAELAERLDRGMDELKERAGLPTESK